MKVLITKMDHMGKGMAFDNNKIIFIPGTIVGDEVEVEIINDKKNYSEGKLVKIIKPSKDRIDIPCPYFDKCGGCQIQMMKYEDTLKYKKERVQNILQRSNIKSDIEVISCDSPYNYRNKIELKIKNKKIGFYENKTHDLININECLITKKCINKVIPFISKMNINSGDILLRCNFNDEVLISITTKDNITFNEEDCPNLKIVGIILNGKTIYGENKFLEKIDDLFFEVSYNSFFQVNSNINSKLFNIIKENVKENTVLDLYSGVGTLSIMASKSAKKVYAIEYIENAVINAIKNAKINNQNNINFILGKVEDKIKYINDTIDTVIVDPPRSGLDEVTINKILELSPGKIIYISCETQKLSEDLNKLLNDYKIKNISILDMFPYTYHVECVCLLCRKD